MTTILNPTVKDVLDIIFWSYIYAPESFKVEINARYIHWIDEVVLTWKHSKSNILYIFIGMLLHLPKWNLPTNWDVLIEMATKYYNYYKKKEEIPEMDPGDLEDIF